MVEVAGTEQIIPAGLVLLAMGLSARGRSAGFVRRRADARGNAKANRVRRRLRDQRAKVFAAGDVRRGQSLVVWAIREGRQAARAVDEFVMGFSDLPR